MSFNFFFVDPFLRANKSLQSSKEFRIVNVLSYSTVSIIVLILHLLRAIIQFGFDYLFRQPVFENLDHSMLLASNLNNYGVNLVFFDSLDYFFCIMNIPF